MTSRTADHRRMAGSAEGRAGAFGRARETGGKFDRRADGGSDVQGEPRGA